MSFKFNFGCDDDNEEEKNIPLAKGSVHRDAKEVLLHWPAVQAQADRVTETVELQNDQHLRMISPSEIEEEVKSKGNAPSDLSKALDINSDLIPHVYEGGLKIWECALDLVQYMAGLDVVWEGQRVLELGCGAGLPGLLAYIHGAEVHFQDYNEQVLRLLTATNVYLNRCVGDEVVSRSIPERCRFYSGDWESLPQAIRPEKPGDHSHKYDVILTSETIYSSESYPRLHNAIKELLKPSGTVYLAAKTYYFGVGGGIREFESYLDGQNVFAHSVCKEVTGGLQREILKLTFKDFT